VCRPSKQKTCWVDRGIVLISKAVTIHLYARDYHKQTNDAVIVRLIAYNSNDLIMYTNISKHCLQ